MSAVPPTVIAEPEPLPPDDTAVPVPVAAAVADLREYLNKLEDELAESKNELTTLRALLEEKTAPEEILELKPEGPDPVEVLRRLEWAGVVQKSPQHVMEPTCPCCGSRKDLGHVAGDKPCALKAVIG